VDDRTETGLVLYDNVRNTHLSAKSGDKDNELNGVNVVGNDDKVGLLVLNEGNAVVETHLGEERLLSILLGLFAIIGSDSLSLLVETSLLLLLGLWAVLVEETEELGSGVLVESVGELGNCRGNLEALVEDDLLALEADVFGPLNKAGQVTSGLDILADTEVLWGLLEERVGGLLCGRLLAEGSSGGLLSGGLLGRLLNHNATKDIVGRSWSR